MSVEAITWALRQPIKQSSAKFVLVVLANCASGDTFLAYPSAVYLANATGQDRKTVLANLARLAEWQLIEDTGKRAGKTAQVVVWRVKCGPDLFTEGTQNRNGSENGTVPKSPAKSPVFPAEGSQKRDTETSVTVKDTTTPRSASRFLEFWAVWPEKVGKAAAEKVWKSKRLDRLADKIIADVPHRAANCGRWLDGFIPNPSTYLRQERWEDALLPRRDGRAVVATQPSTPDQSWRHAGESKLDKAVNWAKQQHSLGLVDADERDRLIREARERHAPEPA